MQFECPESPSVKKKEIYKMEICEKYMKALMVSPA